jgi:hypothetical protein
VKETARTDTRARFYAETPFGQRFLEKSMSPRGTRGRYQDEMRRAGFQQEEKELFQEAWEAMLWQELLRVECVTLLSMHLRLCYLWGWLRSYEDQKAIFPMRE